MSASSKPSISGMLTSIRTTAISFFRRCSSASWPEVALIRFSSRSPQNRFIAQQLCRLVVHHQDVDLAHPRASGRFDLSSAYDPIGAATCAGPTAAVRCSLVSPDIPMLRLPGTFSRSPFIALAVRAMIGSRRNEGFCRITCMVSYPSISGIIMSISTMATSGVDSSVAIASRPVPAVKHGHSAPLQNAAERENIPHVVVDDQHFLAHQCVIRTVQPLEHPLLLRPADRRPRDAETAPFRPANVPATRRPSPRRFAPAIAAARLLRAMSSFPVKTTTGKSLKRWSFAQASPALRIRDMSGRRRSSTTQSKCFLCQRFQRFFSGRSNRHVDVVVSEQLAGC